MGFKSALKRFSGNIGEYMAAEAFGGPGWRDKLQAQRLENEKTAAETGETRARTGVYSAEVVAAQEKLDEAKRRRAKTEQLVTAGVLPEAALGEATAFEYIANENLRKQQAANAAQTETETANLPTPDEAKQARDVARKHAEATAALARAQAGWYTERPRTGTERWVKLTGEDGALYEHNPATGETRPILGPTGQPMKAPPSAAARGAEAMAQGVHETIAHLRQLVRSNPSMTAGPIVGDVSKLYNRKLDPNSPEGQFDFGSNALVDVVYIKSGKQINETELATLRQMIPTRSSADLPGQIDRFERYANSLLQKYGVDDEAGGGAPTGLGLGIPHGTVDRNSLPRQPQPGSAPAPRVRRYNPSTGRLE
jgi:hypothetical protein